MHWGQFIELLEAGQKVLEKLLQTMPQRRQAEVSQQRRLLVDKKTDL